MITRDQAINNQTFYLIESHRRDGKPDRVVAVRRSGKTQTWKTRPDDWSLPTKYGLYRSIRWTHRDARLLYATQEDAQLDIDYPGVETNLARARFYASLWHSGQPSPLYAFASTGTVEDYDAIKRELDKCAAKDDVAFDQLSWLCDYVKDNFAPPVTVAIAWT